MGDPVALARSDLAGGLKSSANGQFPRLVWQQITSCRSRPLSFTGMSTDTDHSRLLGCSLFPSA
jgi:hypothetical protein